MTTAPLEANCTSCRHSRAVLGEEDDGGEVIETPQMECWRYPPLVFPDFDTNLLMFIRPLVTETDTCGEHSL